MVRSVWVFLDYVLFFFEKWVGGGTGDGGNGSSSVKICYISGRFFIGAGERVYRL